MVWTRRLAVAGVLWCAALLVVTTLPGGLPWPMPVVVVSAALPVLPGFVAVVVAGMGTAGLRTGTRAGDAQALRRLARETLPGWVLVASWLLFAGFLVVAMLSLIGSPGVAQEQAGTYVVTNHGETTVITEAQFVALRAREARLAVAVAAAFGVGVAVLSTALLRRKAGEAVRP
ncbi:hypothetical protein [Actinoplanes sp. URMC 104]|uniref:hypothetical protein n=1 Tax=Actinoplanes sp. URMC 104 TaxID=3423409 RepID=UPI003F1C265D